MLREFSLWQPLRMALLAVLGLVIFRAFSVLWLLAPAAAPLGG